MARRTAICDQLHICSSCMDAYRVDGWTYWKGEKESVYKCL